MADLARPVSLRAQVLLVAQLRWRVLINSLRRKNNVSDMLGMIFAGLFGAILVTLPAFAFYFAGYSMVSEARLRWLALPFWAIFVFWQVFPIFAAGFGTGFEFRALLRFPFNASAFYLIGLAYGLADFSALASIFWLAVMTVGAGVAKPGVLAVMAVVVPLFIVLNVTIERLIGSWLQKLLARRRSREIFFGLFILTMFSLQFISQAQNRLWGRGNSKQLARFAEYLSPFPPSLAARVISGAIRHDAADMAVGLLGLTGFVAIFSALLWQRVVAQYRGEELSESEAPSSVGPRRAAQSKVPGQLATLRRRKPTVFLPPLLHAMVRKEFIYFIRNGFAFFLLVLPPAQILLFSSQLAGKHAFFGTGEIKTDLLFPGMMAYTILVMMGPAYNIFAYEGRGIQSYFLAPVTFANILCAKNLLSVAMVGFEVFICGIVLSWGVGAPTISTVAATVLALIFTIAGQLPIANWASLAFPRKLEFGSMRGQRNAGAAIWIMFAVQIVMAGITGLVLWAGRWSGNAWLSAEVFGFLAVAAIAGYFASLPPLSAFAETKKQDLIEALCR